MSFCNRQPVGCDNVLDGTVTFDRCGVCGGNGSTCSSPNEFEFDGVPDDYGKRIPVKEQNVLLFFFFYEILLSLLMMYSMIPFWREAGA